ncbi:MAG: ester cyclase [Actinomycetota bacterium]|jgi:predicted SnoaL-like aldol condensation-catalyzing enzyme
MPTPEEMRELNRRFVDEVFNKQNLDAADEMLADDFAEHADMPPGMTPDKQGALEWFKIAFGMSSDMKMEIVNTIASGDRIASHSVMRGTDTGGAMPGAPPTNKPFEVESIDIMRVNDEGKFTDHWGITDTMAMMQQLGLAPPAEPPPV